MLNIITISFLGKVKMIQGIYTASQGMTSLADKQDQIANNLANIQTTGFKQSSLFTKTFQKYLANDQQQPFVNSEIQPDEVYVDYSEGNMIKTGSPMDVFIKGSGFLTVMTPDGMRYTRNGNLSLNAGGINGDIGWIKSNGKGRVHPGRPEYRRRGFN